MCFIQSGRNVYFHTILKSSGRSFNNPLFHFKLFKGVCGDFDCNKDNDLDCAESRHTLSLTSPDGKVCPAGGNTQVPGETCPGRSGKYCRGLCEKHSSECYIECRDYDTGVVDPNPNQCSITPNESTPHTDDTTCPTAIETGCDNLIDNLGNEWNACKADIDATNDIKNACKFEACIWAGDVDETQMISEGHGCPYSQINKSYSIMTF